MTTILVAGMPRAARIGVIPAWPHAQSWGYGPSGIVGVILIIVLVLFLMGRL